MRVEPGYEPLAEVLQQALDQSQIGKGKECHANGLPFLEQPIVTEGRAVGPGFHVGQARKKVLEAMNCDDDDRAICDYLGAIVYIAALVILRQEGKLSKEKELGKRFSEMVFPDERKSRGQILLEQDQRIKAQAQQGAQMKFFNDLLSQIGKYGTGITGTDGKTLEQRVIEWKEWADFEGCNEFPADWAGKKKDDAIREWACGTAYCEADEGIELDETGVVKTADDEVINYGTIKYGCCSECKLKFNRGAL